MHLHECLEDDVHSPRMFDGMDGLAFLMWPLVTRLVLMLLTALTRMLLVTTALVTTLLTILLICSESERTKGGGTPFVGGVLRLRVLFLAGALGLLVGFGDVTDGAVVVLSKGLSSAALGGAAVVAASAAAFRRSSSSSLCRLTVIRRCLSLRLRDSDTPPLDDDSLAASREEPGSHPNGVLDSYNAPHRN